MDSDDLYRAIQETFRRSPMLVVGAGASVATAGYFGLPFPGMRELGEALRAQVPAELSGEPGALAMWEGCASAIPSLGIEQALVERSVRDPRVLRAIVEVTARVVGEADARFQGLVLSGEAKEFPLQRLVRFLTESTLVVHVATPNYDHMVEYACFASGVMCSDLLVGSVLRCLDPEACRLAALYPVLQRGNGKARSSVRSLPHVALYKPHGSLNWFRTWRGYVEAPRAPHTCERAMVTPGYTKYETSLTHQIFADHREAANTAVSRARALVFYGYGFNDRHLETAVRERLSAGVQAVVLARELTEGARSLARDYDHVIALESDGARAAACHTGGETFAVSAPIWNLDVFLQETLGR